MKGRETTTFQAMKLEGATFQITILSVTLFQKQLGLADLLGLTGDTVGKLYIVIHNTHRPREELSICTHIITVMR